MSGSQKWTDERGGGEAQCQGWPQVQSEAAHYELHAQPTSIAPEPRPHTILSAKPQRKDSPPTVLVGRLEYSEVGGPGDAPGRVLHVVALPIDGAVLVREAEGRLDVGAHVGEHGVLDGNTLHLPTHLAWVQREPGK